MLPHSMIRNQRSKGFNAQKTIQLVFFLVVALWLLYQVKHSFDKKANNAIDYQRKFGVGDGTILMGRKMKPRSQNSMDTDQNGGEVAELIEKEDIEEEDGDGAMKRSLGGSEDEEASLANQDSQEDDMMNNVEKEAETENVDDVAKYKSMNNVEKHAETKNVDDATRYEEGMKEAKEKEVLQLPSQMNRVNSSDQVEDGKEENFGEFDDSAIPAVEKSSNTTLYAQTESSQYPNERGAAENDTKSDAQNIASPTEEKDATSVNNAEPAKDGDARTQDSADSIDTKNEEDISDSLKPNAENNRVMPTNFEASIKDSVDIQVDNATEVETTSNGSSKVVKGGKKLGKKSSRSKKVRGSNASPQDQSQKEEF